jgi:hypothetical protein
MNSDWAQIEAIIREGPGSRTDGRSGACPTTEDLARFVEGGMSRKAKGMTIEHLAGCADCARIVQSLLRLSRGVDDLTGTPGTVLSRPPDLLQQSEEGSKPPLGRKLVLAGLTSFAVLAVVSFFTIFRLERPVVRGMSPEIKLIEPQKGEAIKANDVQFRWEAVPQASRYVVILFGPSLEKVWSGETVSGTSIELPADVLRALVAGGTYFWRVTAVTEEGQEVLSKLSEFSILE